MDPREPQIGKAFVLAHLTEHSAATWSALGSQAFSGRLEVDTENSRYVFDDGIFVARAGNERRSSQSSRSLKGLRLIGFLAREGDLWSLAPRFRPGAHAVLWRPSRNGLRVAGDDHEMAAFVVTSPVRSARLHDPASFTSCDHDSGVFAAAATVLPFSPKGPKVPLAPLSTTRVHRP